MADAMDSKSIGGNIVRVRLPPRPQQVGDELKQATAYIVGVALGDGNLSNSNGRAIRLRVTCDMRYLQIQEEIMSALQKILPDNKISKVPRPRNCLDISVHSNKLQGFIPWEVGKGPKDSQNAHVPAWILEQEIFTKECLRGLLQTDGSIYHDRGYLMINFTNNTLQLCRDVVTMMQKLSFKPTFHQAMNKSGTRKYTVRLARKPDLLIKTIGLYK